MPKIGIREVDNTGTPSLGITQNTVYIPGHATEHVGPTLFASASKFASAFGEDSSYIKDASAHMAHHLLKMGMQVLYEGFVVEESSGTVSAPAIDWSALTDKALYDLRFLTTGAFFCPTAEMIACAAQRCDAVALIDSRETEPSLIRTEVELLCKGAESIAVDSTADVTSFATAFVPTITMIVNGLDGAVEMSVPASFGYLCAFAKSIQTNPMWYAVAGSFRGTIPGLVSVSRKYSNAECEMLQARAKDEEVVLDGAGDNVGIAINPIAEVRPFGPIIWGNRTARTNAMDNDSTGLLKATSFLNVRILSTEVAKTCYNAARRYTFEQNNEILWANFTSQIIPLLDRMETGNGILDYKISRVATNKKARLAAKITLIPIEAVEDFDITIELTDSISITE